MKTINKKSISILARLGMLLGVLFLVSSCEKDMEGEIFQVSDELMIDEIMESKEGLSSFLQLVEMSELRGTIHAYGTYTLFAPTNEGMERYLEGRSVDAVTKEEAAEIVKYHLVLDTLATSDFVDGRLASTNFSGTYLTTKTINKEGEGVVTVVNRQADIIEKDLRGGNGYLHIINNVLTKPTQSISDIVNELSPVEYSIFKAAYAESGMDEWFEALEEAEDKRRFTFFIQDNETYAALGIENLDQLVDRLRENTPEVEGRAELIANYIKYHCSPRLAYVSDLLSTSSLATQVSNQIITLKRNLDQVLLNEFEINGEIEPGAPVDRESDYTDLSCSNGVIHKINGNIEIVKRSAFRVYWDMAEQPEIMALKGFRKAGTSVTYNPGELSEIQWGGKAPGGITYYVTGYPSVITKDNNFVNGDYINFRLCTNTITWIDFTMPLLAEGRYKVWVGMRYINSDGTQDMRTTFKQVGQDDQILGVTTISYGSSPSTYGMTERDEAFHLRLEQDGQRQYNMSHFDTANPCFLLGIIDVATTGRHTIRLEPLKYVRFSPNWDVMLFIPMDDDQIWPKQDVRGKLIYSNTPECEIWPYTVCEDENSGEE